MRMLLLFHRRVEYAVDLDDIIVEQTLDLDHGTWWIWRPAPELCLRLVHHRRKTVQIADVHGEPDAILQARALRLRNQSDVEECLPNSPLCILHQLVCRRIDALHSGDKDEIAGARAETAGPLCLDRAGRLERLDAVRRLASPTLEVRAIAITQDSPSRCCIASLSSKVNHNEGFRPGCTRGALPLTSKLCGPCLTMMVSNSMPVRIGVSFDGFVPTGQAIALAQHAVAAGARSLWMAEHLGYREAIATCMAFAVKAPGAMLVPTAVSPYLWHPMPTAMAMATLDELAPGCAAIAVGTGNPLFLRGVRPRRRQTGARRTGVHAGPASAVER